MAGVRVYLEGCGVPARERLENLVAEAKAANDLAPVTVVPPSPYAGMSLRRMLAAKSGLVNVRFVMAAGLADHLGASAMVGRGKRPLPALVEMAAVRATAKENAERGVLGRVAHHPSLHRSLLAVFRELARLEDNELDLLAGFGSLQTETVRLFRRFRERTRDYYHREEMAAVAAGSVLSQQPPTVLRDIGSVIYYLPANLSPAEQALARALAQVSRCSLILGLTGNAGIDRAVLTLANSFTSNSLSEKERSSGEGSLPDGFVLVARTGKEPLVDGIVSAPDTREEVRRVVRDVLEGARTGTPFHRMAVLYWQSDPYPHQIQLEFRLAGIPVAGPSPRRLKEFAAGRLLLGLLAVIETNFGRSRLMQWIAESPVGNGSAGAVVSEELLHWEAISRRAGVVGGLDQWVGRVSHYTGLIRREIVRLNERPGEDRLANSKEEEVASAGRLIDFLRGLGEHAPPRGVRSWAEFSKWANDILRDYATDSTGWSKEERDTRGRVEDILKQLSGLDSVERAPTLSDFQNVLEEALDVVAGQSGPTGSGVFVAGLKAAVGMEFESVWVVGMADGVFPPKASENQFLPDKVRCILGEGWLSLRSVVAMEELRVYLLALAAGRRRYLSYARTDPVALREQRPAPWLLDAVSLLHDSGTTGKRVSSHDLLHLLAPWLSVIHSPEDALREGDDGRAVDPHEFDLAALACWRRKGGSLDQHPLASSDPSLCRALNMERAQATDDLTEWDGYIGVRALDSDSLSGSLAHVLSPTRLESWAECPFRFFLRSVLSISALDTPEELLIISPIDRGKLIHVILERFVKESVETGLPFPGDAWRISHARRIAAIAEEEFDKVEKSGLAGQPVLWKAAKEEIRQDLETFLERDAHWRAERGVRPYRLEFPFGFEGPPTTLQLPDGGQVSFRGVIDRVDLDPEGLRAVVIDYKTGSTYAYRGMKEDPLGSGTHLQLPIYALAVRDALRNTLRPDVSVEAQYWFVSTKGRFQRETINLGEVEASFRAAVQTIVRGIRGGVFPADPGPTTQFGSANCSSCDFDRLCPVDRQKLWARKRSSPRADAYINLSEVVAAVPDNGERT